MPPKIHLRSVLMDVTQHLLLERSPSGSFQALQHFIDDTGISGR